MNWIAGAVLLAAFAQQPETTSIKVDVDVVNVLCTVRDKRGAYIRDLDKDDFRIYENGKPQQLRYFARETDVPLTVALLLDMSGSVRRFIETEKDTASRFLADVLRPQDKAMLAGFSESVALWQDFTSSPQLLAASLNRMRSVRGLGNMVSWNPRGGTLLYDAIYITADQHLRNQAGRKTIVLITDGLDNGSRGNLNLALRAAQAMDTVIYGIYYAEDKSRANGRGVLKKMSVTTGGRMFRVSDSTPLPSVFDVIREEMRSQYALGYSPTNSAKDGTFRKLEVKLRKKGLTVQARKGYYAFKESERR